MYKKHGSELQFLRDLKRIMPKKEALASELKNLSSNPTESLQFKQNEKFRCFVENIETMGEICMSTQEMNTPSVKMRSGKIKVIRVIDVADGKRDSYYSFGNGIFIKDNIVLTDHVSERILFFDSEAKLDFNIELPNKPYDITSMEEKKLAVSSFAGKEIYIINVVKREIERSLKTANSERGLRFIMNSGEIVFCHDKVLMWFDASSGTLQKETKTKGETFFLYTNASGDYICADGDNTVSCTVGKEKNFSYTNIHLSSPRGIDVDFEGNVYICGYNSNNVHQITSEGSLIRIINSTDPGISSPWVVRFEQKPSRFFINVMQFWKSCNMRNILNTCSIVNQSKHQNKHLL